jgi:uncharacterized protein YndB with AHSA1/START domain
MTQEPSVVHNTFVIERSYLKPPERVFAAFADPAQKRRWFGESRTHDIEKFESDFRVGGIERQGYRFREGTPFPGVELTNEGRFEEIVPNRRIVMTSAMDLGGKRISVALVTFEFLPTDAGTDLIFTHQAVFFEGSGGTEMRQAGWNTLLDRLGAELTNEKAAA